MLSVRGECLSPSAMSRIFGWAEQGNQVLRSCHGHRPAMDEITVAGVLAPQFLDTAKALSTVFFVG